MQGLNIFEDYCDNIDKGLKDITEQITQYIQKNEWGENWGRLDLGVNEFEVRKALLNREIIKISTFKIMIFINFFIYSIFRRYCLNNFFHEVYENFGILMVFKWTYLTQNKY